MKINYYVKCPLVFNKLRFFAQKIQKEEQTKLQKKICQKLENEKNEEEKKIEKQTQKQKEQLFIDDLLSQQNILHNEIEKLKNENLINKKVPKIQNLELKMGLIFLMKIISNKLTQELTTSFFRINDKNSVYYRNFEKC